jgi:hypothetical protein
MPIPLVCRHNVSLVIPIEMSYKSKDDVREGIAAILIVKPQSRKPDGASFFLEMGTL